MCVAAESDDNAFSPFQRLKITLADFKRRADKIKERPPHCKRPSVRWWGKRFGAVSASSLAPLFDFKGRSPLLGGIPQF
jgi:hypothetical protein